MSTLDSLLHMPPQRGSSFAIENSLSAAKSKHVSPFAADDMQKASRYRRFDGASPAALNLQSPGKSEKTPRNASMFLVNVDTAVLGDLESPFNTALPIEAQARQRAASLPPMLRAQVEDYICRLEETGDSFSRAWLHKFVAVPTRLAPMRKVTREDAMAVLNASIDGQASVKDALFAELNFAALTQKNRFKMTLIGPPGTGKSTILKSLGELFGRPIIFVNLDAVADEHALIGHEQSYQGINAGTFLEALIQAQCKNPIVVLEEVDKIGHDDKGNRLRSLLNQWLDDERPYFDSAFLGMRIDLSNVAFVSAINSIVPLKDSEALLQRMGPRIRARGYDEGAQQKILLERLLPRMNNHLPEGLRVTFSPGAVKTLLDMHQAEVGAKSGVRVLEGWANFIVKQAVAADTTVVSEEYVKQALNIFRDEDGPV